MFARDVIDDISTAANDVGIEPAALLAVADVESGGVPYAIVQDRKEPLIRFEGHYFDLRLDGVKQAQARAAGLASPHAGAIPNPRSQPARWLLLMRAEAIDHDAAFESTSWGLGQVMGAHWKRLGYDDVDALVGEARASAAGQARLIARYIEAAGLLDALKRHDWASFARGYNGPLYARSSYDQRVAKAYASYNKPTTPREAPMLTIGTTGEAVEELQRSLVGKGHPLRVDGVFGPLTAAALRNFQRDHALTADAIAGPATLAAFGKSSPRQES